MQFHENKLISQIQHLKEEFDTTTTKLIKELKRQDKIMARSDKRQQQEYDELMDLKIELEETQKEIVFIMGAIGEYRTKELGNHVKRVASYSYLLAKYYGLSHKECELLKYASPMHDIGKVVIPDSILNKAGRLDEQERAFIQKHSAIGYNLLKNSHRELLQVASIIAHEHHEKYNGEGYPNGLSGEEIHIYGRITALADVFDALSSDRVYKKAWDDERIFALLKEEKGKHFDPKLVDIFFKHLDEFLEIRDRLSDPISS